jgi:parvulin-like peptidyl-prolyl isomerase
VRVRHILLTPPAGDAKAAEAARAQLLQIKADLEKQTAEAVAKLPATTEAVAKEQERCKTLDELFAAAAREKSACQSKKEGGDVNWFPRAGSMVEPFAKAAFALKPFQISDPVQTTSGYHLLLLTGKKPGQPTKFEDVKDSVAEVYGMKLREAVVAMMRKDAKITVNPPPAAAAPAPKAPAAAATPMR